MSLKPDILSRPPRLMRAIRKAMAGTESVQERLDDFVTAISKSMQVNVASIYLRRPGGDLELSATKGLLQSAVHKTLLKRGEGLVGYVSRTAQPLNLADAPSHPNFSYRPETGEDKYNSFLGVPVLRGGRVLGVMVVQSVKARIFNEEEVEDLLTVAMLLAEIIVDDERVGGKNAAIKGITLNPIKPESLKARGFAKGIVSGQAVLHNPPVAVTTRIADNIGQEEKRLEEGVAKLRASVDAMVSGEAAGFSRASREIYETYRMFAYDRRWVQRLREAVHSGLTSEAAVERVRNEHRARLMKAPDPYIRARLHDLEDLANRLLRVLSGEPVGPGARDLPDNAIVFARDLGPAELLDYDRSKIVGIVLEEGAPTSHTAIICRATGLPLIGRMEGVLDQVVTGDPVLMDGETGEVHIRPIDVVRENFELRLGIQGEMDKAYAANRDVPTLTQDKKSISLLLNAGLVEDMPHLDECGAEGVGLFRTEFQFMMSDRLPELKEQADLYRKALEIAGDRPLTFRTLDLGGDKILPYMDPVPEENPALGWRAIRIGLDRPALIRFQLRALIAAAAGYNLRVMFPMVTVVDELIRAKNLFNREMKRAKSLGQAMPKSVSVGVMLETPALAWSVDAVCDHVDFVSVGANDLMQFFFASDRDNVRVCDRYDPMHPAALSILKFVVDGCHRNNVPISLCGEIAGRPLEAVALVALGYRKLSMPVSGVGPVKAAILALDADKLEAELAAHINIGSRLTTLRGVIEDFCEKTGVPI